MTRLARTVRISASLAMVATPHIVFAECVPPHVLTNGQVADASQVMENFSSIAACVDAADEASVKPTGTPATGSVAVFTSGKSIGTGNLTGDVSTSGGTATTLSPSGVVAGTYANATLAVDSKGRITSAASGSGGGGDPAAIVRIGRVVADGTSGTVTFSSIPQVFEDLILIVTGQSVNPVQDLVAYANGDETNANYRNFTWNRFGVGAVAAPRIGVFPGLGIPNAGTAAHIRTEFLAYSSSVWKKNALTDTDYEDSPNYFRMIMDWKWNNTAPITQLKLTIPSGNFAQGSTFTCPSSEHLAQIAA